MGTATFDICRSGRTNDNVPGKFRTSGAHTTSTSASNLTDGAAGGGSAITARLGDILHINVDENARVMFGGEAATATLGFILFANQARDLEVSADGTISIIDVA
jgi:hypothetical protein